MALSAQAEWYGVYFFPFFLRKAFSLIVCYFVSGNNPRKAHKLKTEKYLKLLFLPPNKSTKRNRFLFWLNMVSIFFLCPLSFSDKECKKKREEIAINYEEEKKKKEIYAFTWRNTHIKYLQQRTLGTSVQKALFYHHRTWRNSFCTCPFVSGPSKMVAIAQMTKGKKQTGAMAITPT